MIEVLQILTISSGVYLPPPNGQPAENAEEQFHVQECREKKKKECREQLHRRNSELTTDQRGEGCPAEESVGALRLWGGWTSQSDE